MILKIIGLLLLAIPTALWGFHSAAREWVRLETQIRGHHAIEHIEEVTLNGTKQKIFVRTENSELPLLLFLHGGPGFPALPYTRHLETELPKHFTLVHWDQRGSGLSFNADIAKELTLDILYKDTHDLIQTLLKKYKQKKLFLVGQSWGSILGLKTALRHPDLLHAYIGVSQIIDVHKGPLLGHNFVLEKIKKLNHQGDLKTLEALGTPPYSAEEMKIFRPLMMKYGGILHQPIRNQLAWQAITSPEYTLHDIQNVFQGFNLSGQALNAQILKEVKFKMPQTSHTPTFFMHGHYDQLVPSQLISDYFQKLKAPSKGFYWFNKSAHSPNKEEPLKFQGLLKEIKEKINLK